MRVSGIGPNYSRQGYQQPFRSAGAVRVLEEKKAMRDLIGLSSATPYNFRTGNK
jgi:hypothetical protein